MHTLSTTKNVMPSTDHSLAQVTQLHKQERLKLEEQSSPRLFGAQLPPSPRILESVSLSSIPSMTVPESLVGTSCFTPRSSKGDDAKVATASSSATHETTDLENDHQVMRKLQL